MQEEEEVWFNDIDSQGEKDFINDLDLQEKNFQIFDDDQQFKTTQDYEYESELKTYKQLKQQYIEVRNQRNIFLQKQQVSIDQINNHKNQIFKTEQSTQYIQKEIKQLLKRRRTKMQQKIKQLNDQQKEKNKLYGSLELGDEIDEIKGLSYKDLYDNKAEDLFVTWKPRKKDQKAPYGSYVNYQDVIDYAPEKLFEAYPKYFYFDWDNQN